MGPQPYKPSDNVSRSFAGPRATEQRAPSETGGLALFSTQRHEWYVQLMERRRVAAANRR